MIIMFPKPKNTYQLISTAIKYIKGDKKSTMKFSIPKTKINLL